MHNCKATRDRITELLLDGPTTPTNELLAELRRCANCREEFDALTDTLRVTTRVMNSATPTEDYWLGYHARLKQKLEAKRLPVQPTREPSWLRQVFTTSVPVPIPIAVGLVLLFGVSLFFVSWAAETREVQPPLVLQVPVEVPVIQEKTVTRVVYRDRYRSSIARKLNQSNGPAGEPTLARSQKNDVVTTSLLGFKPLDEIKLTVIKGGSANDK